MIAYIQGHLSLAEPAAVVIDVHGVGYEIRISLRTYSLIKALKEVKLNTYLHIKEDGHTLYGFFEPEEKRLFMNLIGISGIGPGTALVVLSSLSAAELVNAIVKEDIRTIQAVKGIGAKTAQRLVLELKDKLRKEGSVSSSHNYSLPSQPSVYHEALSALVALGIAKNIAEKNLDQIIKIHGETSTVEQLIKLSLKTA